MWHCYKCGEGLPEDCTCNQPFSPTESDKVKIVEMAAKLLTSLTLPHVDSTTAFGDLSNGKKVRMMLSFVNLERVVER